MSEHADPATVHPLPYGETTHYALSRALETERAKRRELETLLGTAVRSRMHCRFPPHAWLARSRVLLGMTCPSGHGSDKSCVYCTPPT